MTVKSDSIYYRLIFFSNTVLIGSFQNYVRKFSNVAADLERLQKCTNELQVTHIHLSPYEKLTKLGCVDSYGSMLKLNEIH